MTKRYLVVIFGAALVSSVAYYALIRDARPILTRVDDAKGGEILVGANVQASAAKGQIQHDGCTIVADPTDSGHLFAASMHWHAPDEAGVVGYASRDRGTSWALMIERIGQPPTTRLGDEALAFGPTGGMFLAHMRGTRDADKSRAVTEFVYSGDHGKTWEDRTHFAAFVDRPQIEVDCTGGRFSGRIYCNADDGAPMFFASKDGARTFERARLPNPRLPTVYPSNPVILPDGAVMIAYRKNGTNALDPPSISVLRSTDGGSTFEAATAVPTAWRDARATSNSAVWAVYPLLAADNKSTQFAGRLYCVWADGPTTDQRFILFSVSSDCGQTWSAPRVLSEQPLGQNAADGWQAEIPLIAINRDGVIAVSWYDRRGLAKATRRPDGTIVRAGYNLRLRASFDGGRSWIPSVQVNELPGRGDLLDVRFWAGMAADADGNFHPAWISDSTGVRQIWTATVVVRMAALRAAHSAN